MREKQFPQIPNELVSTCPMGVQMIVENVLEAEEMCWFTDFYNLYFLIGVDCQVEHEDYKFQLAFLTNRDQ